MPLSTVDELFDKGFLRRLEALALAARQLVRGRMKAERRSVQRGSSIEFAEYRPFTPGDDWRYIDWHAFARWKQLVLKLFVEEEDLHVHILLDCTVSMEWGTPLKYDYARRVAAGMAFMGLSNLDRISLVPLGSADYESWQPSRGRHRFLPILRWLAACPLAEKKVTLEDAVRQWSATKPRRGLVILISDLFGTDLEDALKALDRIRYGRHEAAAIQIMDPDEQQAGEPGEYEFHDMEYGERRRVIVDAASAREFNEQFTGYQKKIQTYCRRNRISLLQADTSLPVEDLLLRALRQGGFFK